MIGYVASQKDFGDFPRNEKVNKVGRSENGAGSNRCSKPLLTKIVMYKQNPPQTGCVRIMTYQGLCKLVDLEWNVLGSMV